ncbi:MAG: thiamine-phosphate kinase [Candidatus Nanopelagicales bacterium]|jgi:thiamine-monophosphate kinase
MAGDTVGDLGEIAVVARILEAAGAEASARVPVGPGDDAAVLACTDGRVVVTTDMLVEGRHFRRDWSEPADIGHKAAAENLADIAAMGAVPTALVVAMALPPETEVAWVDGFLAGLLAEAQRAGAALIGGDLVRGDAITVGVTAFGDLSGRTPILRSGARSGDVVAVCGSLGTAAGGLAVLSRGFRSPRVLVDAHRRPQPDYRAGVRASDAGAHALMDISDGLLLDAERMARASSVVIDIESDALPREDAVISTASAYNLDPLTWVLGGGDDHALLATFDAGAALPEGFVRVGTVMDAVGQGAGVRVDGREVDQVAGFEHFRA